MVPAESHNHNYRGKMEYPCLECILNHENICIGCNRTINEIVLWHKLPEEIQKKIMKRGKVEEIDETR